MNRRGFLRMAGAALGAGVVVGLPRPLRAASPGFTVPLSEYPVTPVPRLAPVRVRPDRIVKTTVGLRPFRPTGPNLSVEKLGRKTLVHNYGHGGSGWSLSWGTATVATENALRTGEDAYAVIGCGAAGLTTASLLQRAGKKVTIYAKARPPQVTSFLATGVWSPDSRICLAEHATPAFVDTWEKLCRTSHRHYQNLLGLPGGPIEWVDRYYVADIPPEEMRRRREHGEGEPAFGHFEDRITDLTPRPDLIPEPDRPFDAPYVTRTSQMVYNLTLLSKVLTDAFIAEGGRIEVREFTSPDQLRSLPEKTIINATGLGAKELFGDTSLVPVRGQLTVLIPQPEVTYGLACDGASMVPRRDGLIVQSGQPSDYGSTDLSPSAEESEKALLALAKTVARLRA